MKILAIGDFHGRVPRFLKKVIKKEKPDLIISTGDYCGDHGNEFFFRYVYATDLAFEDVLGKKKWKKLENLNIKEGKETIKFLNKFKIPIFTVSGNNDRSGYKDIGETNSAKYKWNEKPSRWCGCNESGVTKAHPTT